MEQVIRAFLETLRKTQFMPAAQMRDLQRGLLEQLVRHARANVPLYRDTGRLAPLFRADDSIDWDRWRDIPPLTRGDLQTNFEQLRSEFVPAVHGQTFVLSTSGSTGEPVSVVHTVLSRNIGWIAILLRDYDRYGVDPRRRRAFLAPFSPSVLKLDEIRRRDTWYPEFVSLGLAGEQFNICDIRPIGDLVDAVDSLHPDYMRVQPPVLELMLTHDAEERLAAIRVRALIMIGEHLSDELKSAIATQLQCPILEHYGSGECGRMASSCPHCGQFHVHAETTLLEVVDDNGKATTPGDTGRIIVTPLYNYAMPLIRYDHADEAQVGIATHCPITLPALNSIFGKKRDPFVFPGGIVIRPVLPTKAIVENLGAQAYQVAQISADTCEIRIVPGKIPPSDMRFDAMTELIRSLWWRELKVNYRILDQLPRRSAAGKIPTFVREMPQA